MPKAHFGGNSGRDPDGGARYASSAANKQPLSYVVVKTPQKVQEVLQSEVGGISSEGTGTAEGWRRAGAVYRRGAEFENQPELRYGRRAGDFGNMTLAAWNHGVGSCIIGACNRQKLSELFGLTEDQKLHTVVAFGYPSHISRIENVEKDGDIRYHLDVDGNYIVPKLTLKMS